ncbi:putative protein NYNRIN-like, partial [Trifolium medium]|nr:putative protein NYNRIN-like [Trifolium medium]
MSTLSWFADMANFKAGGLILEDYSPQQQKKLFNDAKHYFWDDPFLFKVGHHSGPRTAAKILQSGFFWPTLFKDCVDFVKVCDKCQRTGTISRRDEMPLKGMLEVEPFDCWGIDFMGPFPFSKSNLHILVCVDYVTKWVEAKACQANDSKTVVTFL